MADSAVQLIISPKFENFGGIMFLLPPPAHANACTGHNFVTNTPIKFIFAIAIEVPDYKNLLIFGINREKQNGLWWSFCIKCSKNV